MSRRPIPVVDAAGAAAADAAAIAAGIPSRALMQRAGAAAAAEVAHRYPELLIHGVVVATGAANNGGDGWVVARALHDAGVRVRVVECAAARTEDAMFERSLAVASGVPVEHGAPALLAGGELLFVDALFGTGYSTRTPLNPGIVPAIDALIAAHSRGATLVAIDVPSGVDASTGESASSLACALTLTFGTIKRGQLVARDRCGTIVLLDIGLPAIAADAREPHAVLATPSWFRENLPAIPANAHKGTRKKVAIVGGASGMAGAAILAARAALRSGAGLVKCVVEQASVAAVQEAVPAALTTAWPTDAESARREVGAWADAVLVGPGLGRPHAREIVERILASGDSPMVLDADALNVYEGDLATLGTLIGTRQALLTPHPLEFSRLTGLSVADVSAQRFDAPSHAAQQCGATILLKGVPTVVASPDRRVMVVAEGNAVLATGGAGDMLGGIAVTLLAQCGDAHGAGSLAAFAHGRAAELASIHGVRGHTLDDVLVALAEAWATAPATPRPPVLVELVGQSDSQTVGQ